MKNNSYVAFIALRNPIIRLIIYMKLSIIPLMLSSLVLCGKEVYAQKERITLKVTATPIGDILKSIETQTPYLFFYNHKEINAEERQTLSVENEQLDRVLGKLFAGRGISYKMVDSHIVLSPSSQVESIGNLLQSSISGTVSGNSEPLAGVSIAVKGT